MDLAEIVSRLTLCVLEECSAVLTVALVNESNAAANQGLLDLGYCGVRTAVALSKRAGWSALREIISRAQEEATVRILETRIALIAVMHETCAVVEVSLAERRLSAAKTGSLRR
jgi:hypothetical protein